VLHMIKHRYLIAMVVAFMCLSSAPQLTSADETDPIDSISTSSEPEAAKGIAGLGLHFMGFWSMEFGQLENAYMLSNFTTHQNILRSYINFGVSKQVSEALQVNAGGEIKMYYNSFNQTERAGVESFFLPAMYFNFYMDQANLIYSLGGIKSPYLQFTLGYFPFKYNPDVRDLGEYLYRSGTYPAYLVTDFDYPQARLAGLKVSSDLFNMLHQDLLLTASTDRLPFYDLNLGYIATIDLAKTLKIGIGGLYQSLWPANDNLTTPRIPENMYIKNAVVDSLGNLVSGDTMYYTAAGLKLMGRFSFDPKGFAGYSEDDGILGREDLKLYGEIAILGLQNYPASTPVNTNNMYGYDTLWHKMPITLGLNLPTFKALDVLTAQVEYYGCTYPTNYEYKDQAQYTPTPIIGSQVHLDAHNYASIDNWKWAVYAKKTFSNGIFLVGQVACDHIRNETPVLSFVDLEESLRTNRSFWWVLKLGYRF
jgi:hypothetical protein